MKAIALIGGAFLALILFFVGIQTCEYHPELAGTAGYQTCSFGVGQNWLYLLLAAAVVLGILAILHFRKRPTQRSNYRGGR